MSADFYQYSEGTFDNLIVDIIEKPKSADNLPIVRTIMYFSEGKPFFCRWNVDLKRADRLANLDKDDIIKGTLGIEELDLQNPSKAESGKNYIKIIKGKPLKKILTKHDIVEYQFEHPYNLDNNHRLLHHVILPKDYYCSKPNEVNKNATAWIVNKRQCITWPNPHNENLRYNVSFKFAGPDHNEFQKIMSKEKEAKRKYVDISKENTEKILSFVTVIKDILEISKTLRT